MTGRRGTTVLAELLLAFVLVGIAVASASNQTSAEAPSPSGFIVPPRANGGLAPICIECGMPIREGYIRQRPGLPTVSPEERAISGILNDYSLRPGDLVMFPDGLKVFQGGSIPYSMESFRRQPGYPRPRRGVVAPQSLQ